MNSSKEKFSPCRATRFEHALRSEEILSSTPDLDSVTAADNQTNLHKLIDKLTRQDLAKRVSELERINSV
jgi:hypothetical protein